MKIDMKHQFFLSIILLTVSSVLGQTKDHPLETTQALENIQIVFDSYVENQESTDSKDNKEMVTKCLESLLVVRNPETLEILINVWMYYDPTDFPSIDLIIPILKNSRPESISAVKSRIENKKDWETNDTAPFSELSELLDQLKNDEKTTLEFMQGKWYHSKDSVASLSVINTQVTFAY